MHKLKIAFLLALTAVLLAGCGKGNVDRTTITLHKDGKVEHTILESFDTTTENGLEELKQSVLEEIATYNNGSDQKISISKVEAAGDQQVKVVMSYPDMQAFHDFNNMNSGQDAVCFFGTVQEAYDAGYDLSKVTVYEDGDTTKAVTGDEILSMGDRHIFIYDNAMNLGEPMDFAAYDPISYCSGQVKITNKKAEITAPAGTLVYLILK